MRSGYMFSLLAIFSSTPAVACTIVPPPPMTSAQREAAADLRDREFVEYASNSQAIVKIRVLTSSGRNFSKAHVRIVKVLRGKADVGRVLTLKTVGASLCGAGGLRRREVGHIILEPGRKKQFNGFIEGHRLQPLRDECFI